MPSRWPKRLRLSIGQCPPSLVSWSPQPPAVCACLPTSHSYIYSWVHLASPKHPFLLPMSGENVREFFFRVAALTFEANVLAELEKSGARRIGDVVRKCSSS